MIVAEKLPAFRTDLEIVPYQSEGKGIRYLIRIPETEEGFEFGEEEYYLSRQFDGATSLAAIAGAFQDHFRLPLPLRQLEAFVLNLANMGLLVDDGTFPKNPPPADTDTRSWPLCNPDPFLRHLARKMACCFSDAFVAVPVVLSMIALGVAVRYGGDFFYGLNSTFRHERFIYFVTVPSLGFFLVYPLGEIAKGMACRHYGGQVPRFSLGFLYRCIPRFSSHIWDALWFLTKRQRIIVFAAGPISQLLLLDMALIGWKNSTPYSGVSFCWSFLVLAAALYLLLNLNPFIQRDGYFMLVNWLEIRDLRDRAEAWARAWFRGRPMPEPLDAGELKLFLWYGGFSILFSILFTWLVLGIAGQLLTATFQGVGALLFLCIVYVRFEDFFRKQWLRIPFVRGMIMNQEGFIKYRIVKRVVPVILLIVIGLLPYPFEAGGDFRILPAAQLGIRSEVAATINEVLVAENEMVKKGQPVAILDDRVPKKQIEAINASIDEVEAMLALRRKGGKPEEIAKARQEIDTAAKALEYSEQEATRFKKMFDRQAVPETEYQNALMRRDLDRERLELAKNNLAIVKSGAQNEEVEALEAKIHRLTIERNHAEEALRASTLFSPIDGRIITPYLSQKVGQRLETGELFAVVEDTSTYIAEIEIPEEHIEEVRIGAEVKLRTWSHPQTTIRARTTAIAPVAYDKTWRRLVRTLSERESYIGQKEVLRDKGKVVRVLSEFPDASGIVRSDMTGYAKIACETKPVAVAFTSWLMRFIFVEIWSWIP
jgi:putative peptide zinc metalloprotease protein